MFTTKTDFLTKDTKNNSKKKNISENKNLFNLSRLCCIKT